MGGCADALRRGYSQAAGRIKKKETEAGKEKTVTEFIRNKKCSETDNETRQIQNLLTQTSNHAFQTWTTLVT